MNKSELASLFGYDPFKPQLSGYPTRHRSLPGVPHAPRRLVPLTLDEKRVRRLQISIGFAIIYNHCSWQCLTYCVMYRRNITRRLAGSSPRSLWCMATSMPFDSCLTLTSEYDLQLMPQLRMLCDFRHLQLTRYQQSAERLQLSS